MIFFHNLTIRPCRPVTCLLFALLLMIFSAPDLPAQSAQERAQQRERETREISGEEETEAGLTDAGDGALQDVEFDFGGFLSATYYHLREDRSFEANVANDPIDPTEKTRVFRMFDLKLWANLVYKDTHQLYFRPMANITDYNNGDEYRYTSGFTMEENDLNWPRLDVGYYYGDITRALNITEIGQLRFKAGRDYISVGEGLAMDIRGDGGIMEYSLGDFAFDTFMVRSIYSEDSYNRTHPDMGHNKNLFSGFELRQKFADELEVFGYSVWLLDKNKKQYSYDPNIQGLLPPNTDDPGMYQYDSRYHGAGFRGQVGAGLTYYTEYTVQYGDQYSNMGVFVPPPTPANITVSTKDEIEAHAFQAGADYVFTTTPTEPQLGVQFIFGSGDHDSGITTDSYTKQGLARRGNLPGTRDNTYFSYGFIETGYAFFPLVSNIEIWKIELNNTPIKDHAVLGDIETGIKYFKYRRHQSSGGISDRAADKIGSDLGYEIDFSVNWRPYSDFMISAQYGLFRPDSASFTDTTPRAYASVGFMLYF